MKGFPKDVSDLIHAAVKQKWTVKRTENNHLWFRPADGGDPILVGGTPRSRGNKNDRARLRRAGLKF